MFLGQFYHNLDDKGRLTIPARFRESLSADGAFVLQGFDKNLMVLTAPAFKILTGRINNMSITDPTARLLRRLLFSTANQIDIDKSGRILIPQFLRKAADIKNSVVLVGSGEYFEIWSPEVWESQEEQIQDVQSNAHRFSELNLTYN
jgi:MraZ protein